MQIHHCLKPLLHFFLLFVFSAALRAEFVPTPDQALGFALKDDPRPWQQAYMNGTKEGFIMEFVIKGDNVEQWKELVAQQIVFTKMPLKSYVAAWKTAMKKAAPDFEIKDDASTSDSVLVSYTAASANEMGVRRFLQGTDGIYSLAYTVRPKLAKPDILALWKKILLGASLQPNPQK